MDILIQSVAKAVDHPKDKLVIELLPTMQGRRRLKASAEAFSLRIILLFTEALQSKVQQNLEEHIERIPQKLLGTSDLSGNSGGLKAALLFELQDQGKAVPVWLQSATVKQPSPPVFSEEITYTLPAGASTSTTNIFAPAQPNEDSSSVRTLLIVFSVVIVTFCITGGAVTYWLQRGKVSPASNPVNSCVDEEAPVAIDAIELDVETI